MFDKDQGGRSSTDRRKTSQPCLLVTPLGMTGVWVDCEVWVTGTIGPLPRIKVSDMLGYDESRKPGAAARVEQRLGACVVFCRMLLTGLSQGCVACQPAPKRRRKGVDCHREILNAFARGMDFRPGDRFVVLDLLPNRYCEFSRAVVSRTLAGETPNIFYVGAFSKHQKDMYDLMIGEVYKHWDKSSEAPPAARPRTQAEINLPLTLLTWEAASRVPGWPPSLDNKFEEGTPEAEELATAKKEFFDTFPAAAASSAANQSSQAGTPQPQRVSGTPDYAQSSPLDTTRDVDLPKVREAALTVDRRVGARLIFFA